MLHTYLILSYFKQFFYTFYGIYIFALSTVSNTVYIYIYIQLQWHGHVKRMEEGRLPKEVMKWRPTGRIKRGRPKLTWAEGIRGLMGEKGLT